MDRLSQKGDVLREEELKKKAVVEAALDKLLWHSKCFFVLKNVSPWEQTAKVGQP